MSQLPEPVKKAFDGMDMPERAAMAFSFDGWYLIGKDLDPTPIELRQVYAAILVEEGKDEAQKVLDNARKQCFKLRTSLRKRGLHFREGKQITDALNKLRDELADAGEFKKQLPADLTGAIT